MTAPHHEIAASVLAAIRAGDAEDRRQLAASLRELAAALHRIADAIAPEVPARD